MRTALLVPSLLLVAVACGFERRPDRAASTEEAPDTAAVTDPVLDSIGATVDAFRRSVAVGDVVRILSLLDPAASAVGEGGALRSGPAFAEAAGAAAERGEAPTGAPPTRSDVRFLGEAALVVNRYGPSVPGGTPTVETLVLVRSPDDGAWRVLHVHGGEPDPPEPGEEAPGREDDPTAPPPH